MKTQREIEEELVRLARSHLDGIYDPRTHRISVDPRAGDRDTYVYAMCLLANDSAEDRQEAERAILAVTDGVDHFSPCHAAFIHAKWGRVLSGAVVAALRGTIERALPMQMSMNFRRGNVNQPLMAVYTCFVGGGILENHAALERGEEMLDTLITQLGDVGLLSEYNSPCYGAVDVHVLAWMVHHVADERIRGKAQVLLERVWMELVLHYHPESQQLAGPHSRSYHDDLVGGMGGMRLILYKLLDGNLFYDPAVSVEYNHQINWDFGAFVATQDFFLPQYLQTLLRRRTYPLMIQARSRCQDYTKAGEHYPGGFGDTTTYMTQRYSLSSASRLYVDGDQCNGLVATWAKRKIASMADFKVMFTRYISNDKGPAGATLFYEEGRLNVLQQRNRAIVLYQPKKRCSEGVTSLKASVILPLYGEVDEIRVNGESVGKLPLSFSFTKTVCVRDGGVAFGLRALGITSIGCGEEGLIETKDKHLFISFYNYQGPARTFSEMELNGVKNGFIIEFMERQDEFEEFCVRMQCTLVEEKNPVPYLRLVRYRSADDELRVTFNQLTQTYEERTINGERYLPPVFLADCLVQSTSGRACLGGTTAWTDPGIPLILMADQCQAWYMAMCLCTQQAPLKLITPLGTVVAHGLTLGRIVVYSGDTPTVDVLTSEIHSPILLDGFTTGARLTVNGLAG